MAMAPTKDDIRALSPLVTSAFEFTTAWMGKGNEREKRQKIKKLLPRTSCSPALSYLALL
jgi:hypothetical protein